MKTQEVTTRVINYKRMRKLIGSIAFLMPFAVWLLSGHPKLSSISISYWTYSQDIFVGSLFAVGFFMSAYNGPSKYEKGERWLSRAACGFAVGVALFPTLDFNGHIDAAPAWVLSITGDKPHFVHYASAILLFACLSLMLLIFSFRASRKDKPGRSVTYLVLCLGMIIGMPALYFVLDNVFGRYDALFYVEWLGLGLFGAGWYIAGAYKTEETAVPSRMTLLKTIEHVDPGQRNVSTGLIVVPDVHYFITAEGFWKDWIIPCGPNGWGPKWRVFTCKNRIPGQPFFMLCGNIGKSCDEDLMFGIGEKKSWTAPDKVERLDDRELYLFANDWPTDAAYANNKEMGAEQGGPLTVTIYRVH